MDIGGSAPRIYTLDTMKHTGTRYVAYDDVSYHMYQLPGTRYGSIYARTWCVTSSQTIIEGGAR